MPSPNPTAGEEKKKAKRKQHHLKRSEVPEDAVGLKVCWPFAFQGCRKFTDDFIAGLRDSYPSDFGCFLKRCHT